MKLVFSENKKDYYALTVTKYGRILSFTENESRANNKLVFKDLTVVKNYYKERTTGKSNFELV